jgi:hypothetical protein
LRRPENGLARGRREKGEGRREEREKGERRKEKGEGRENKEEWATFEPPKGSSTRAYNFRKCLLLLGLRRCDDRLRGSGWGDQSDSVSYALGFLILELTKLKKKSLFKKTSGIKLLCLGFQNFFKKKVHTRSLMSSGFFFGLERGSVGTLGELLDSVVSLES